MIEKWKLLATVSNIPSAATVHFVSRQTTHVSSHVGRESLFLHPHSLQRIPTKDSLTFHDHGINHFAGNKPLVYINPNEMPSPEMTMKKTL